MRKLITLLGITILLVACSTPQSATPAPTQQPILVTYPPALQAWVEKISACASANPLIAIYTAQTPPADTMIFSDEIALSLGEPAGIDSSSSLWQVGKESFAIIINADNDQVTVSSNELEVIFSGETDRWETGTPIQVWVLPDGDPVRQVFDQAILHGQKISSSAMLAPDPAAMLEAVAKEAGAIGYLPQSAISAAETTLADKVKSLPLEASLENLLTRPVIAITHSEPHTQARELLVCLRSSPR